VEAKDSRPLSFRRSRLVLNQTARNRRADEGGSGYGDRRVTGATPLLQTQSTEVSTLIDSHFRHGSAFGPGAITCSWRCSRRARPPMIKWNFEPHNLDNSSRPFINGNREQANQYFLDGQLNSEIR